ncbi:glycoside hydrolase family 113 [Enterococcus sp. JM9B]|uniref:glycoside hydrolase family 113 n=1 Tax=Enterococcus sp. JM9B TaxID=1857216 RepID=UPI001374B95A|nr:1,4-beta-xylanase [Enterococcus sp. JM9B]KAF1304506.1 1,4-beta-xylanase [Enterococcus sp. JM9B]
MDFIKGVTFGFMSKRGEWETQQAKKSLRLMKDRCAANYVILPIVVEQKTTQSTEIEWKAESTLMNKEIEGMIDYSKKNGLKVVLKPMVNVTDGTWRAHINFFDHDVPGEPKWSEWFASYTEYLLYYAALAEKNKCDMLVIGCELVNSDRRENEWRELIRKIRIVYSGLITYNCDKYQESNITWWDAVDVISSSGYYPIDKWEQELDRIEKVILKEEKPFFFCEVGCPSRTGSEYLPNKWELSGNVSLTAQEEWYQTMFTACLKRKWVQGFGLWDWKVALYPKVKAKLDGDYALYGKPVEEVIYSFYKNI